MEDVLQRSLPISAQFNQQEKFEVSKGDSLATWPKLISVKEDLRRNEARNADFCTWKAANNGRVYSDLQDRAALLASIQVCAKQNDLRKGSSVHASILDRGLLGKDIALGNALLTMYAKCGALAKAQEIFDQLPTRNVVTWNALISAYVQHGLDAEALQLYDNMQNEGLSPNAITFICTSKACGHISAVEKGEEIHFKARSQGLLEKDVALGTAFVDMYAKCGVLSKAQRVFDELPVRNLATWTSLIGGYAQQGLGEEALCCYSQMRAEGLSPNAITFVCVLKVCSIISDAEKGEEIHREVCRQGLIEKEIIVGNALVDMYAKCGALAKAQEVFKELPSRNTATWTVLISGYVQHGLDHEALRCFDNMQEEGLCPDEVTLICVLQACGSVGALEKGEGLCASVRRQDLIFGDIVLGTALVDMYAKCAKITKAQEVFEELPARSVTTWTALMSGYAQIGNMNAVFYLFYRMLGEGVKPNSVTFVTLLNACSHAGLVKEGKIHFEIMSKSYSLIPSSEHYTCVIDILSRAGHFDEAMSLIQYVQPSDCRSLWSSLMVPVENGAMWSW